MNNNLKIYQFENGHIVVAMRKMNESVCRIRHAVLSFLLLCMVCSSCTTLAQISTRIEESAGVAYYMHTVEAKQTLYSLSKLYKCDINEITAANPGTDSGLREGQVVRIPVNKCQVKGSTLVVNNGENFMLHEVKKKESLFSIAQRYNIDVNVLMAANPGTEAGIKKGQQLRIPVRKETPVAAPSGSTAPHTVQQGETLYSIAKQYSLRVEDIQNTNGGLKDGLKAGAVIQIPTNIGPPVPGDNNTSLADKRFGKEVYIEGPVFEEQYDIALMLPFYISYTDSMEARDKKLRDVAIQLYRGAMMAADSLVKIGLNAKVHVYDVVDEKGYVNVLIEKPEMKNMDLIIGPAAKDRITELNKWASENSVHVVCPVQLPNNVLLTSPNMSKTVPSSITLWTSMAKHIHAAHPNANIIIVDSKLIDDRKLVNSFKEEWKRLTGDTMMHTVIVNDASSFTIKEKYAIGKTNIVVVPTNEKKVIATLFKNLGEGDIIVYGTEAWDDMESISVANRNKYHVHFPQTAHIDYTNAHTQRWIEAYRKRFKTEPGNYAVSGFDMMMYYGTGLKQFGRAFPNHFDEIKTTTYGTGFDYFKTSDEGGFENQYIIVVGTDNFELVREK
ncbi:MAG: LysM peptidoglycan-binding domain-containing protein [Flavobacteriales bacterium]